MVETTSSIGPPQVNIEDEMRASYLDYAMSVIIGRALPDVRDGLKPVHRRILYAMYTEGLLHNRKYSKCAGVVGEVLKKYHPHGDAAVYDSLVRMAQPWNLRYPLVDGQGNFGSIDGDPAAAYRYTESRMEKMAEELLKDIEKDTADFIPNFDGATEEPTVLPSRLPNLLVNGSTGIAVGMATNIPPHNLREIIDAAILLARNSDTSIEEVMKLVPGPDFPTGGIIYGKEGINQAYRTGRGIVSVRGKAAIEVHPKTNRASIIVTEIPYQVNKARLIERIALLVRDKKLQGISDVRDESDRDGMRMVVDLKRDAVPQVVLNQLFKHTPLQNSFGIIMLAIVGGQPRVLNLKEAIGHYIDHRREVIRRRCVFELEQARARAHILEGLQIALDHIDEVIKIIRASKEPAVAKAGLIERFELSAIQAQAILDMRLQKLTGLEREKIAAELAALRTEIDRLAAILEDVAKLMNVVIEELEEVREAYGDERRTDIVVSSEELSIEDLIADEEQMVTITHAGYIKRTALNLYRRQKRGGRGRTGMKARDEDFIEDVFVASTHSTIMVVTQAGRAYALKVHEVPEAGPTARGTAIVNLVRLRPDEAVASIVPIDSFEQEAEAFLVMVSISGNIKKTALSAYANINVSGIIAMGVDDGDGIISAVLTTGSQELMITSRQGMAVRFREQNVRGMGRTARGVRGIKLREDDAVVSMEVVNPGATILTVTELGYGKRTELDEYRLTSRGGVGVKTCRITDRNGPVVDSMQVSADDDIIMITDGGMVVRTQVGGVSIMGRDTQGVRVINLKKGEHLVGLARLAEQEEQEEQEGEEGAEDKQGKTGVETEGGDEEA